MFDQLEYLAAHAVEGCPSGCADCARLIQVKNLLLPFLFSSRTRPLPNGVIWASTDSRDLVS
jgi:hypothetical protein